jgi:hypothetical protein
MCQEKRFKFCLDTRNNEALPLDPACPEHLSVRSPTGLHYGWLQIVQRHNFENKGLVIEGN